MFNKSQKYQFSSIFSIYKLTQYPANLRVKDVVLARRDYRQGSYT